ncbi:hypothetical protein BU25DRAFT_432606 [Macroventuria anomochaeta]|uniref:Uncharacterized protein n=1 Tax=Macroventuria anomochaeta TaxID=301207 RepID=A0ACB6RY22_9PLEO|nr:uncharacterized protein BU25DRAFT_432606 [Macroventuria anomochaeta]KAF2626048.1 hypothetical protein BU25DRAFT_432606 [Macroventuria anomochaeta]
MRRRSHMSSSRVVYIQTDDFESLKKVNTALLDTAIRAIEQISPQLKMVILQTGGKGYGLEFPDKVPINPHLRENMPRISEPYASKILYYSQYDLLTELSKGKDRMFAEARPDGIIGFTPVGNAMNLSQRIGLYLTIYREVHGAVDVWPKLRDHFDLVGKGPGFDPVPMEKFVKSNINAWKKPTETHGLEEKALEEQNWPFVRFMLIYLDFDRQYNLTRSREAGFEEEIDTADRYLKAWERMRKAKILPLRVA